MSGDRAGRRGIRAGRLRELLLAVKDSFWFIPSAGLLAAVLLGIALIEVEAAVDVQLAERWPRLFGSGAEGARGMLSAIASSMITVAGVVFSMTVVALSLAASAYSPRVLRTFMRDRPTQAAFAVFVGVFVYCLVVLRTVRDPSEGVGFIPSIAVFTALVLALVGVWVLVYFIHHVAVSIQVSTILGRIAAETRSTIRNLYPDDLALGEDEAERAPDPHVSWRIVPARRTGYIVALDTEALLAFACRRGVDLRMELAIGDFAIEGLPLAALARGGGDAGDAADAVDSAFAVAAERTIEQDPAFGIQQIVDVAARALSPGINNPSTAALCIDHLSAIFVELARRRMPLVALGDAGAPCVIGKGPTFDSLVEAAFAPLVRDAAGNAETLAHLERCARRVLAVTPPQRRIAIQRHIEAIERARRAS